MSDSSLHSLPLPHGELLLTRAIEALTSAGVQFARPAKYQLKVGDLSYYPTTGTIVRDGHYRALRRRSVDTFITLVDRTQRTASTGRLILADDDEATPEITLRLHVQ